jgi:hypothetical protein
MTVMREACSGGHRLAQPYQERNSAVNSKSDPPRGVAAGVGGLGNVLIGKVIVVVSSKQQARKTVPTLPIHWIALKMKT